MKRAEAIFPEDVRKKLMKRCAQTRVNRMHFIDKAARYRSRAIMLGSLKGSVSVVSTMLGALSFAHGPEAGSFHNAATLCNGLLSVVAALESFCPYDELTKKMNDWSNRWSSLNREIESKLYTQPHQSPAKLANDLDDAVSKFVDDLTEAKLNDFVKHKGDRDVEKELEEHTEFMWKEAEAEKEILA